MSKSMKQNTGREETGKGFCLLYNIFLVKADRITLAFVKECMIDTQTGWEDEKPPANPVFHPTTKAPSAQFSGSPSGP